MPSDIIIVLDAGHGTLKIEGYARFTGGLVSHQPIISIAQVIDQQPQLLVFGPSAQLWLRGSIDGAPDEAFYLTWTLPRGHNGNSSFQYRNVWYGAGRHGPFTVPAAVPFRSPYAAKLPGGELHIEAAETPAAAKTSDNGSSPDQTPRSAPRFLEPV